MSNIDEWANKQAVQLVELCASEGISEVAENCFQSYMEELADVSRQRDASPALQEQIGVLSRIKRPTIRQLINAAALQGVSVRDILLTPREAAAQPLLDQWAERTILPLDMGRHDDVVREVARLCTCLWRSRGKVLMPSLRFILKDFGIHRSFFKEFRPDFYTRSIDLFEGQLEGADQDLYRKIFPIALNTLRGMHQDRSGVMRWRLHCLVAQRSGLSREVIAPACNSALAYHKLAKAAKERLGKTDTMREAQGSASSAYRGGSLAAKPEQASFF